MEPSFAGFAVCVALLLAGYWFGAPLTIGLMASLAFGATAIVTLSSLGGSSPLVYTVFAALLLVSVATRERIWRELGAVFARHWAAWVVTGLAAYAVAGSVILPRLFAGQTSTFVTSRTQGVYEAPLAPVAGNISQTGYFVIGALTFLALSALLLDGRRLPTITRAFLVWSTLQAVLGLMDLMAKTAGAGDILEPLRSASYVMLTEDEEAGFSRIVGAYSEASAFGAASLASLAFTFTYWRHTRSAYALGLSVLLAVLLLLSTSTTAYAGLAILCIPVAFSIARNMLAGGLSREDLALVVFFFIAAVAALAIYLRDATVFEPFRQLFDTVVVNKASSSSGQERAYWNYRSFQSFLDTAGLGVGLGSSRASSWVIAVLSQLGLLGSLMLGALIAAVSRGFGRLEEQGKAEIVALGSSARSCAVAGIVSAALINGTADPGILFFIALAVVLACRIQLSGYRQSPAPAPSYPADAAAHAFYIGRSHAK